MPFFTLARPVSNPPAIRKRITRTGELLTIAPDAHSRTWTFTTHPFSTFDQAAEMLVTAAEEGKTCLVRGAIKPGLPLVTGRLAVNFDGFGHILTLDLDSIPLDGPTPDLSALATRLYTALPAPFAGHGALVQFTASQGIKPGLRARVWLGTEAPVTPHEITAGLLGGRNSIALKDWTDADVDCSVWRLAQPNYLATPIFPDDTPDPVPVRWHRFTGPLLSVSTLDSYIAVMAAEPVRASSPGDGTADLGDLAAALAHLPDAAIPYETWFGYGCACYRAAGDDAFDVWDEWSQVSDKYDSNTAEAKWEKVRQACTRSTGPIITVGSIFKAAADAGWMRDAVNNLEAVEEEPEPPRAFGILRNTFAQPGQGARYLFHQLFPNIPGEVGSIVAPSSAGKSVFVCGLAAALATGTDYLGARNRAPGRVGVLIVSGESLDDTGRSLQALRLRGSLPLDVPVAQVAMPAIAELGKLLDAVDTELRDTCGVPLGVVFFDTLSRCFAPLFRERGQNASEPNTELVAMLAKLSRAKGRNLAMWTLDHTGKDVDRGARGSSAKDADVAAWLSLEKPRGESVGVVRVVKVKGASDDLPGFAYSIEGENLWIETIDRGDLGPPEQEQITGAVMVPADLPPIKKRGQPAKGPGQVFPLLDANPGLTKSELVAVAQRAGLPRRTAYDAIGSLLLTGGAHDRDGRLYAGPASQIFDAVLD